MRRLQYLFLGGVFLLVASSANAQVANLNAVQMVDPDVGYIVGTGGTILKSVNGGLNWYSLPGSTSRTLYDVNFLNTATGGVTGGDALASANVISRTENGGQNWTNQPAGISTVLSGIVHLNTLDAVVVGNAGQILRTTDAGSSWSAVASGVTVNLKKLSFPGSATGYIVGWSGTILRTDDGGASWSGLSSGTTTILYDVDFVSTDIGTAVGYSGTILRTTNGGASWSPQTSGTVESLYGVDFVDQNNGFIVGSTGLFLRTADGGSTWTRILPGTYQNLNGVSFQSPTTGIIVGGSQTILRTTDGGSTWTQAAVDSTAPTPTPPPAPLLVSPADGATGIPLPPTFSWNPSAGATGYRLQVSSDSGFTSVVYDDASLTGLSTTVGGLGYGSTYYWHVNAANAEGTSQWSGSRSFTTEPNAQVTVQAVPAGRSFTVDGVAHTGSHTFTFNPGETHSLSTDSVQSESGGGRFLWAGWSDGGARSHAISFPGKDTTITVSFTRQFFLTMTPDTGGTVSPPSAWYDSAAVVEISAHASAGYSFVSWSGTGAGSYSGAADTSTVTMGGPVTEYADFTLSPVPVAVTTDPPGLTLTVDGVVYTSPGFFSWLPGSSHTVSTDSLQVESGGGRFRWSGWSDGGTRSHGISFSGADTVISASFTRQFFLTMTPDTGGTVSPPSAWYDSAAVVEISAHASAGYSFVSWSGTGTGSYSGAADTSTVTMGGPVTQHAEFAQSTVPVTVTTSPPGLGVTVDGVAYTAPRSFNWISGSSHTISTDSLQGGDSTEPRYRWTGWSDGGARTHLTAPSVPLTFIAFFGPQFMLTTLADSGGTVAPSTGWYDSAQAVNISAAALPGYIFNGWTGSGPGSYTGPANPSQVVMNGPIVETGHFLPGPVSVNVETNVPGLLVTVDGVSGPAPRSFSWTAGSVHTIGTDSLQDGVQGTRYRWTGWNDAGARTHTVNPVADTVYRAFFGTQYLLTTGTDSGGMVSPGTTWYTSDRVVYLTAFPDSGFEFAGWTGSGSGSYTGPDNPAAVTVSGPINQTAHFTPIPVLPPEVTTLAAGSVSSQSAVLNGTVNPNGDPATAWFEWGTDSALSVYDVTPSQAVGSGSIVQGFGEGLTGLAAQTTYYFRAGAANSAGTTTGVIRSFTTDTQAVSGPEFALTRSALDFGAVMVGSQKTDSVMILNLGDAPLSVSSIAATSGEYSVSMSSTNVPPGGSRLLHVTFVPNGTGGGGSWLTMTHNDPGSPDSVLLSGSGYTPAMPVLSGSSLTFVYPDGPELQTRELYIRNAGDVTLFVDTIESANSQYFAEMPVAQIAPGDSQPVSVTCNPDTGQAPDGYIVIRYAGTSPPDTVSLTYDIVLAAGLDGNLPETPVLRQNYPNPFNPSTNVSFVLAERSRVVLTVYDILGRRVEIVVDEVLGPGEYTRRWNAGGQPAGVYYYRLQAGEYTGTRSMVLTR